jgi:Ca2+-binding RTX toxin-like protein
VGGTGSDVLNGDDGNDNITTGTSLTATGAAGGSDTVNGGAGNDTIVFGGNLDALDRVDGGDGTDTVSLTNDSLTTLKAMTISEANTFNTNFVSVETLQVTDALNQTSFDLGYLNSLTSVRLDAGIDGNETINGFDSGETLDLRATLSATLTVGVNNAAASTADSFTIRLAQSADVDYTDVSIANVETVNIVSTESTANALVRAQTIGLTLSQATGGAAQTVNVTGLESLTIDTAIAAGTINASGMTVGLATDAGLTMGVGFTATTAITGQTITGSGKVDALRGSTGADVIDAGAGNDTVHGSRGADSVDGGEGTDTYSTTASQVAANIQGAGTGTSTGVAINLGTTAVTAAAINFALGGNNGLSAASTSLAGGTVQYVFGTQSNFNATTTSTLTNIENITLAGNGNNYVVGSATANVIVGGTGVDHINGGAGNDTITGGAGADVLTGGTGTDTFVFATGASGIVVADADTITDFVTGTDKISTSKVAGAGTIADGTALADFAAFIVAADAALNPGAGNDDVYISWNAFATGNAYIVIDEDDSGSVNAGDTLIILTGINLAAEIALADFL